MGCPISIHPPGRRRRNRRRLDSTQRTVPVRSLIPVRTRRTGGFIGSAKPSLDARQVAGPSLSGAACRPGRESRLCRASDRFSQRIMAQLVPDAALDSIIVPGSIGSGIWAMSSDLTRFLNEWPFEPGKLNVRLVEAEDGEPRIQVRLDLGVLQMFV